MSTRNFWIVKGNKKFPNSQDNRDGRQREMLEGPESVSVWATKKAIPEDFKKGDGVFYWSSSPDRFVIGLGKVRNPEHPSDDECFNCFLVKNLTGAFERTSARRAVGIDVLRDHLPRSSNGDVATFLKAAVAQTIYALTVEQARYLAKRIIQIDQCTVTHFRGWGLLT